MACAWSQNLRSGRREWTSARWSWTSTFAPWHECTHTHMCTNMHTHTYFKVICTQKHTYFKSVLILWIWWYLVDILFYLNKTIIVSLPFYALCSLSMLKKTLWACEIGLWELNKKRCTKSWPPFSSTLLYTDILAFLHFTSPRDDQLITRKDWRWAKFLEVSVHDFPCCFTLVARQCVTKRVCVRGMGGVAVWLLHISLT